MPKLLIATLTAVMAFNLPARAQHMNQKDSPCADVVITVELANCLSEARDRADARLSAVYKSVRARLSADDTQRLITTQRLWIRYRDANCSAERNLYQGGTASHPAYLACLEAMTRARTKELAVSYTVRTK